MQTMALAIIADLGEFLQIPTILAGTLEVVSRFLLDIVQLSFILMFYLCLKPGQASLLLSSSVIPSLLQAGEGFLWLLHLLLLYPFYVVPLSFVVQSYSISPQLFFQKNCSISGSTFSVFVGGGVYMVFLCHHLEPD